MRGNAVEVKNTTVNYNIGGARSRLSRTMCIEKIPLVPSSLSLPVANVG